MKKRLGFMICILFLCLGCYTGCASEEEKVSVDEAFIKSLASAMETGWDLWEEQIKKGAGTGVRDSGYINTNNACIEEELNAILPYQEKDFEDDALKEKMNAYIDYLYQRQEALQYPNVELQKYYDLWDAAYNEQSILIASFVNDYGLTVGEKYQKKLDDWLELAEIVEKLKEQEQRGEEQKREAEKLLHSIAFELDDVGGVRKTYSAVVENITELAFAYVYLDITFLNSNNEVVEIIRKEITDFEIGDIETITVSTNKKIAAVEISMEWQSK